MSGLVVDPFILAGLLTPIYYFQFKQTQEMGRLRSDLTAVATKQGLCGICPVKVNK